MATKRTKRAPAKASKKASASHDHDHDFLRWDFAPQFVHPTGVHGVPEHQAADDADLDFESICGNIDDSQAVELYDGSLGVTQGFVQAHESPVGQLQWNDNLAAVYDNPGNVSGVRWCTGTLITNELFLTAGHCFDQSGGGWQRPLIDGTNNVIPPSEIATNMQVNFDFQVDGNGVLKNEQSFPVLELMEYRIDGLDYAIVRLGGSPGTTFGTTGISDTDAAQGDMLCIIQHPAGLPKRIEAGPATDLHDTRIGYNDIDTLGGSSGSGVLGPAGTIVGVHTNGGCTAQAQGHNHGQRISAVIASSPIVADLATPPPKFKFRDDPLKFKFFDDMPKFKFQDDVKFAFFDIPKQVAMDNPFLPGFGQRFGGLFGGLGRRAGVARGEASAAPFVLRTPHHAHPGGHRAHAQDAGGTEGYEAAIAQLEAAMQAGVEQLQQLDQQYRQLLAAYQGTGGGRTS